MAISADYALVWLAIEKDTSERPSVGRCLFVCGIDRENDPFYSAYVFARTRFVSPVRPKYQTGKIEGALCQADNGLSPIPTGWDAFDFITWSGCLFLRSNLNAGILTLL